MTGKKRGTGKPFKKGKGPERDPRINAAGAPKGESWRSVLNELLAMDGPSVTAWASDQAKEFQKLPAGVPLRSLVCLWAIASLSRDFSPGVWTALMDRTDGKVGDFEARIRALEALLDAKEREGQL